MAAADKAPKADPPKSEYTWDSHVLGWSCFKGGLKLCNYNTFSDMGLYRNGTVVHEPVPAETRLLHFTSPSMSVDDLKAILESLPSVEDHPHSK